MPDASFVDTATGVTTGGVRASGLALSRRGRLMLVVLGFTPLLHVLAVAVPLAIAAADGVSWPSAFAAAAVVLYVVPPIVVRATGGGQLPPRRVELGSAPFFRWWSSAQWQIVFNRLPFLEEVLRLVPGLYSAWLRLWGSRVGGLVYWSPGVVVLDRQWLRIGSRVVFGAGVRLNAHAIARHRTERTALFAGAITVGDDAMIGGYSLLLPGCEVAAGESTPPLRTIHPFSLWRGGRHATNIDQGLAESRS